MNKPQHIISSFANPPATGPAAVNRIHGHLLPLGHVRSEVGPGCLGNVFVQLVHFTIGIFFMVEQRIRRDICRRDTNCKLCIFVQIVFCSWHCSARIAKENKATSVVFSLWCARSNEVLLLPLAQPQNRKSSEEEIWVRSLLFACSEIAFFFET